MPESIIPLYLQTATLPLIPRASAVSASQSRERPNPDQSPGSHESHTHKHVSDNKSLGPIKQLMRMSAPAHSKKTDAYVGARSLKKSDAYVGARSLKKTTDAYVDARSLKKNI